MGEFPKQRIEQILEDGEPVQTSLEDQIKFSEQVKNGSYSEPYPTGTESHELAVAGAGSAAGSYNAAGFPGPEMFLNGIEVYSTLPQEWQALAAPGAIVAGVLTYQAGKETLKYIFK